jgi:hypothetical protein
VQGLPFLDKPSHSFENRLYGREDLSTSWALLLVYLLFAASGTGCKPTVDQGSQATKSADQARSNSTEVLDSAKVATSSDSRIDFVNMTADLKADFIYRNGEPRQQCTILESLGGGVGIIDFDRDGKPDFFCTGGGDFIDKTTVGLPCELFRNIGFSSTQPLMVAVGQFAGNGFPANHYNHGAIVADSDQDGFQDILVTGYGGLQLWRNQGDGSFIEIHEEVGLTDTLWSSGAAWADFNNDGILDLYVVHYADWSFKNHPFCRGRTAEERDICPPAQFTGLPDTLYIGSADGTYRDESESWKLKKDGKGLGALVADFDGNGFVDVYVANDTVNNFLYTNSGNSTFEEIGLLAGVATDKAGVPNGSMGLDVCDFDQTGRPDIWVTNYEREDFALYRNEAANAFLHVSDIAGLNVLGGLFVGFGTASADFDLDSREDIMVNNGHVILFPTASPRKQVPVFMLAEKNRFRRVMFSKESYFSEGHDGRGLALVDIDSDGDLDPIFSNINAPLAILRNDSPKSNHWFQLKLIGTKSNRDAIGAIATAVVPQGKLVRVRKGGGSYLSTSQEALSWGLGETDKIQKLTVRWPSGKETILENIPANQLLTLVEPDHE